MQSLKWHVGPHTLDGYSFLPSEGWWIEQRWVGGLTKYRTRGRAYIAKRKKSSLAKSSMPTPLESYENYDHIILLFDFNSVRYPNDDCDLISISVLKQILWIVESKLFGFFLGTHRKYLWTILSVYTTWAYIVLVLMRQKFRISQAKQNRSQTHAITLEITNWSYEISLQRLRILSPIDHLQITGKKQYGLSIKELFGIYRHKKQHLQTGNKAYER